MPRHRKNKNELLQELTEEWRKKTNSSSINTTEVAVWLMREKGWEPRPADAIKALKKELQVALREQRIEDPQGRRVRAKHPQRIYRELKDGSHEQLVLWHDIREATRPQMQAAFQQRRFGIALDCRHLKNDVDSYNENWNKSVPVQLVLDFTEDVEELEHGDDEDYDIDE